MKSKLLDGSYHSRTFVLVLQTGDEAVECLTSFAAEQEIRSAFLSGLGAFSNSVVAFFDWTTKTYRNIPIDEQVEVLSIAGNLTRSPDLRSPAYPSEDELKLHAHVVLGKADGTAHGGHLVKGYVRPTLEILVREVPHVLRRTTDPESRLPLIDL